MNLKWNCEAAIRSRLAVALLLVGALLTLGAKWTEQPIQDFNSVAGAWKGTYIKDGKKYPASLNIKADGSYEGEDWQGPLKGTLTIKEGRIQYQGGEQHHFTLTLQQRKKKRLLKGSDESGELRVSLKPTKTKRAKRKKKKKTKVSLAEAKEITATFEQPIFTPPPRTINDITAVLAQEKPDDLASYQKALALADSSPPATTDAGELANFYLDRARAAHEIGRARQEIEDYRLAVKYGKESSFKYLTDAMFSLGFAEGRSGNYSRGIQMVEAAIVRDDRVVARAIRSSLIARIHAEAGDLKAAKSALRRAKQNKLETLHWTDLIDKWRALMAAAISTGRAGVLDATGRLGKAERYHRRAIAQSDPYYKDITSAGIDPKGWTRGFHWMVAGLADNLRRQGRLVEAEVVVRKAVRGALRSHGRYSAHTADMIRRLNAVIFEQGRYAEAEALARANLDIYQRTGTAGDSAFLALARQVLADALLAQARWHEALSEYDAIREALKTDPQGYERHIAGNLNQAFALIKGGRAGEALTLVRPVFEQKKALLGETHYDTAEVRGVLAIALAANGDKEGALTEFAKAIPILLQRSRRSDDADTTQSARQLRLGWILEAYIRLLSDIRETAVEAKAGIDAAAEVFRIADVARGRTVQRALSASGARAAARDPALADVVRREQDALTQMAALYGLLSNALSAQQSAAVIKDLRTRLDRLRGARAALMKEVEARFPQYAQLINPKPANIADVQSNLRPGETLIALYVIDDRTYIWAVPRSGKVAFAVVPLGSKELQQRVNTLRQALDPQAATLGDIPTFDVKTAYELYVALLKPVEGGWKGAKHLLMVTHGPLGQLPLAVLPTAPVRLGKDKAPLFRQYKEVPWLARTHTITVLPSVSSLVTLRRLPAGDPTRRAYAGFGDPWFNQAQATEAKAATTAAVATRGLTVRGLPLKRRSVPQTRSATSADLAKLPRLPDTAAEVKSIALALSADLTTDVFVGALASETQVKTMDLSDRKVIAFATHGLVPGDLDGLVQPALALSSPAVTGGKEDGLLTMGEILGLKLNADWIVLSACNTAAADGGGAEAVSGLGRAFFYAGARALLVSNWPVETTSAKALTTDLFKRQAKDPTLTRTQALQQAMLHLIDGSGRTDAQGRTVFSYAHPIFWAPFSVVGDGGT